MKKQVWNSQEYRDNCTEPSTHGGSVAAIDPSLVAATTSAGNFYEKANYFITLPGNVDIFSKIKNRVFEINDLNIRQFVINFILLFQEILSKSHIVSNYLPPLTINFPPDGSVLLEWIFKDFRVGFSVEPKIEESGWYLVANKNFDEFSWSGSLVLSELNSVLNDKIIPFVLRNT